MQVLVLKYYRYSAVKNDPRFSLNIAFKRLNGVLEVVKNALPKAHITVIVHEEEVSDARSYLQDGMSHEIYSFSMLMNDKGFFKDNAPMLVFDEQGFYTSPGLIRSVFDLFNSYQERIACTWNDPDRLLWSFNYDLDSCRFFFAPSTIVKNALKDNGDFCQLQEEVFKNSEKQYYRISTQDILSIYHQAVNYNPYPYHFCIEPTSRCNSKCVMCPFHSSDPNIVKGRVYVGDNGFDMPLATFKKLVDEIDCIGWNYLPYKRNPQITVQLRGEPTLAPNCREMFSYVKKKGFKLSFSTNGSVLHENGLAEFLIDIGIDEIIVSIDGDEKEYSRVRPQLDYKQVVDNIKLLRKLRDEKGNGVPILYTKRVRLRSSNEEADKRYIEKFSDMVDWAGIAFENFDDFKTEGKGFTNYFFEVEDQKRLPCILASDVAVVKSDGMVDMCYGAAEHYIGNVCDKSLLDILRDSSLRQEILRNQSRGNMCEPSFCECCTSWKSNFSRAMEENKYTVQMKPILAK